MSLVPRDASCATERLSRTNNVAEKHKCVHTTQTRADWSTSPGDTVAAHHEHSQLTCSCTYSGACGRDASAWRFGAPARIFRRLQQEVDGAEAWASPVISGGLSRHSASRDAELLARLYSGIEQTRPTGGTKDSHLAPLSPPNLQFAVYWEHQFLGPSRHNPDYLNPIPADPLFCVPFAKGNLGACPTQLLNFWSK